MVPTDQDVFLLNELAGDATRLAAQAAKQPEVFVAWCRATLAAAAQGPGLAHLLALPEDERRPLAQLLLHAATCHHYAVATAAAAAARAGRPWDGWPYEQPCREPLFAALKPTHQAWLISDVLDAVWCADSR
jgi:hypothetical protein